MNEQNHQPPERYQKGLWDIPEEPTAPAVASSETSVAAAKHITPKIGTLQRRVLVALIGSSDGMTDLEIQKHLDMDGSTQRPRRVWLHQHGYVRDSGRKRATPSGRQAVVWEWTGKELL